MQKTGSTILWQGKWTFRLDHMLLDSGRPFTLALIDHPGSVVLVPLLDDNVLMVSQYRPVIGHTVLELPAGTLDSPAEPFVDAAQRELREETGYRAGRLVHLGEMLPSPGTTNELMQLFLALDLTPDPLPMDEDEIIDLVHVPLAELVAQALGGALPDAKSVVGVLRAQTWLRDNAQATNSAAGQ